MACAKEVPRQRLVHDGDLAGAGVEQLRGEGPALVLRLVPGSPERQDLSGVEQRDVDGEMLEARVRALPLA